LHPNSRIIIAADNDDAGIAKAKEAAKKSSAEAIFPKFSEQATLLPKPTDFNDLHALQGIHEVQKQLAKRRLNPIGVFDFLAMDIKPKEFVLEPFCPVKGLVMVFGYRGGGKTFFALSIALAIAGGSSTLNFRAPKARKVLYIDGEMASISLHERISHFCLAKQKETLPPSNDFFRIITPDLEEDIIPSLVTEEGQNAVQELMKDFDCFLLITSVVWLAFLMRTPILLNGEKRKNFFLSLEGLAKQYLSYITQENREK
jgi:putative DNA primase/helicase